MYMSCACVRASFMPPGLRGVCVCVCVYACVCVCLAIKASIFSILLHYKVYVTLYSTHTYTHTHTHTHTLPSLGDILNMAYYSLGNFRREKTFGGEP